MTRRETVRMVLRLAKLFNADRRTEWGLPERAGRQPNQIAANTFFMGCAVDGGQQRAEIAWRQAQRFVLGVVPYDRRTTLWSWIVESHRSLDEWNERLLKYRLHRNKRWHARIYRFAKALSELFDDDPRRLWRGVPADVAPIDHVRSVLHILRFGPALSRMLIGALRDHELVVGATPFKDDIHVCRGMHRLGLSRSDRSKDVLEAGEHLFGKDNWQVDRVFYRLGKDGYQTRREIEGYYRARVLGRRDQKARQSWRRHEQEWSDVVLSAKTRLGERLRGDGWGVRAEHRDGEIGLYLVRRRGRLAAEFASRDLYLWTGVSLDVTDTAVYLVTGFEFGIDGRAARSLSFRDRLLKDGYVDCYFDGVGWESHYKTLRTYRVDQDPRQLRRAVDALVLAVLDGKRALSVLLR